MTEDRTERTDPTDQSDRTKRDLAARRGTETNVYQPAEDSGLLASAVEKRGGGRLLEVGTGSGWVAARAARDAPDVTSVVASDLSPHACRAARRRAVEGDGDEAYGDGAASDQADDDGAVLDDPAPAGTPPLFEVVRANLVAPFADDAFDTVAFNPPYLPTDPENEWDDWMERALSGGESGRELIDPFLETVGRVLAPGGVALLLVSSLTGYDAVLDRIDQCGFDHEVVVEESYPFETLSVLALTPRAEN